MARVSANESSASSDAIRKPRRSGMCVNTRSIWSVTGRANLAVKTARRSRERNHRVTRITDPQTGVAQDSLVARAAMCVRLVDVRITCGLHDDAQLAAVFIDPRAK
ncbi:unnamed protein product [Allacma fusca]|uniref:Uncharacterized protein n=1 Tax=Allacma fusca TaxID=39272 RepID=A0A8J2PLS4_9HEXA|nr:unnamed protein product [Allacma fusca]